MRPVNVLSAFTGRFVVGCLVVLVVLVIGIDFGLFESVWLVVLGWRLCGNTALMSRLFLEFMMICR